MGQLKFLERRLQKDKALKQCYQETIDTDVKIGYIRKVDLHGAGLAIFEIFSFIVNICKFFILCCFSCSLKAKYPNFEVLRAT